MILKEILFRNGLKTQYTTNSPQTSCPQSSSFPKKTTFTQKFDHNNQQVWEQEAVGFGPFWSEYDMWI